MQLKIRLNCYFVSLYHYFKKKLFESLKMLAAIHRSETRLHVCNSAMHGEMELIRSRLYAPKKRIQHAFCSLPISFFFVNETLPLKYSLMNAIFNRMDGGFTHWHCPWYQDTLLALVEAPYCSLSTPIVTLVLKLNLLH